MQMKLRSKLTFWRVGYCMVVGALCSIAGTAYAAAQTAPGVPVYHNPILFADYSDPDVIRVGADYYLVASTFHFVPGIPILHSRDLVHWSTSGHVVDRITLAPEYDMQGGFRYGRGSNSALPQRAVLRVLPYAG